MKKPLILVIAIVIGIVATNALLTKKSPAQGALVEDSIDTSQAASKQVDGNIPF